MLWFLRRFLPRDNDPNLLRLRPEAGFGDHLMLAAVIEGLKAERPELRIRVAARYPEMFVNNPHVEELLNARKLRKRDPRHLEEYLHVLHRPPVERYLQVTGHLIDDMYECVGVPLRNRPHQPKIYLTDKELRFREPELERLPRPRIAIVPHGKADRRLPNKVYPADQWDELAHLLTGLPGTVLHLGSSKDGPSIPGTVDFRDVGLRETGALLRRCDLLVTHVGGIMHLGAAVRVPTVVLYGAAEHPAISGYPWNRNLYVPIECGPCWMEEVCDHHSCMKQLTPERVLAEVRAELNLPLA